jgi:SAM-dependent methyltransferase
LDQRPWYVDFFDGHYLRIFEPVLPSERTAAEVNAVVERLGLPLGARLLDLCCGQGRHAVPLAQLGFQVTGLDLSRPLLDRAAALAGGQGRRVGLVQADMRRLPFADASFDAVLNLFNAFGYLEDDATPRTSWSWARWPGSCAPAAASSRRWPTARPCSAAGTTAT